MSIISVFIKIEGSRPKIALKKANIKAFLLILKLVFFIVNFLPVYTDMVLKSFAKELDARMHLFRLFLIAQLVKFP